jgi:hypothetical protein
MPHTLSFLRGAAFAPSATGGLLPVPPVISIAVVCIELPVHGPWIKRAQCEQGGRSREASS